MGGSSSVPAGSLLYPPPAGTTIGYDVNPNVHLITTPFQSSPSGALPTGTALAAAAASSSSAAAPTAGHVMSLF